MDQKTRKYKRSQVRKKLEDERHKMIDEAMKSIHIFQPPFDYKRPTKTQEKVYIPAREFLKINFMGQLIGPQGNTLKKIIQKTGARITIRGFGSVKEEEKVTKAVEWIEKIIETSTSVPEGENKLKQSQLCELDALDGILRDDEQQSCLNCGAPGQRRFECPQRQNVAPRLTCYICNGGGHIACDCEQRNNTQVMHQAHQKEAQLDNEYMNLMAELGDNSDRINRGSGTPWQQQKQEGATAPWSKNTHEPPPGASNDASWQQNGYYGVQSQDMYQAQHAYQSQDAYYNAHGSHDYSGYYDQSQTAPPPPAGSIATWQQQLPPPESSAYWHQEQAPPGKNPWNSIAPPPPGAA